MLQKPPVLFIMVVILEKNMPIRRSITVKRVCKNCKLLLNVSEFERRHRGKKAILAVCRVCRSAALRAKFKHLSKENRNRRSLELRNIVWGYKREHPCVDCGEVDPIVLEFDHVRGIKKFDISKRDGGCSVSRLLAEIKKCDIRCANCHRRKTMRVLGILPKSHLDWRITVFADNI